MTCSVLSRFTDNVTESFSKCCLNMTLFLIANSTYNFFRLYRFNFFCFSICEEFQNIQDRALREPETSEELIDMISFVENARTQGMVQLNERITQSKDRLAYLIDVFLFNPEDIDLNCEVLTWPKRINPVFDKNEEVCIYLCLNCRIQSFKTSTFQSLFPFVFSDNIFSLLICCPHHQIDIQSKVLAFKSFVSTRW